MQKLLEGFTSPQIIKISAATTKKAKKFAEAVIGTVYYGDSYQFNKEKIQRDHYVSKLGEEAVASICKKYGCTIEGPDYTIYKGNKKSWDSDLIVDGEDLAVKTQSLKSAKRYGTSWVFQSSQVRKDPVLEEKDTFVCFVVCDLTKKECTVYPVKKISELVFADPKLKYLVGKKKVVYLKDIDFNP